LGLEQQTSFACGALGKLRLPGFAGFEDADSCGEDAHDSGFFFSSHELHKFSRMIMKKVHG